MIEDDDEEEIPTLVSTDQLAKIVPVTILTGFLGSGRQH